MRLIDADEAYKVLTDYYHHRTEIQHKALEEAIERVPTVDPVKHGHWIKSEKSDHEWECSACGYGLSDYRTTYCYDCGAKMDEVNNETY